MNFPSPLGIPAAICLITVFLTGAAHSDTCGAVGCSDLTGTKANEAFQILMESVGTDCRDVQTVKMLDHSQLGIMHLYTVTCYDGSDVAHYNVIHEPVIREFNFHKLSGKWMDSVKIRY